MISSRISAHRRIAKKACNLQRGTRGDKGQIRSRAAPWATPSAAPCFSLFSLCSLSGAQGGAGTLPLMLLLTSVALLTLALLTPRPPPLSLSPSRRVSCSPDTARCAHAALFRRHLAPPPLSPSSRFPGPSNCVPRHVSARAFLPAPRKPSHATEPPSLFRSLSLSLVPHARTRTHTSFVLRIDASFPLREPPRGRLAPAPSAAPFTSSPNHARGRTF